MLGEAKSIESLMSASNRLLVRVDNIWLMLTLILEVNFHVQTTIQELHQLLKSKCSRGESSPIHFKLQSESIKV